jgi:DNA-binding Xre family transcriptional regulator
MAMKLKVKEIAEKVGIKNAAQLRNVTGLGMQSCYQLWEGEAKMISLETLNTLCNVLQVGPAMLFEYTPDVVSRAGEPTPAASKKESRRSSPRTSKGESRKVKAAAVATA